MSNAAGSGGNFSSVSRSVEWACYDRLPPDWKAWLQQTEFDLSSYDVIRLYLDGMPLKKARRYWQQIMNLHKLQSGLAIGHNGVTKHDTQAFYELQV